MRTLLFAALLGCGPPGGVDGAEPPPDHTPAFRTTHSTTEPRCASCHGPDPCVRCHANQRPRDHGPGFAHGIHGAEFRATPERCVTCHTADHCAQCH